MPELTMKQFSEKVNRWYKDFPRAAAEGLDRAAQSVYAEVIDKHLSGPKMGWGRGSKTNATLGIGSGDLMRSISTRLITSGSRINAQIGTFKYKLKYAAIHEYGGTIYPKNKKALRFNAGGKFFTVKKVTIPERSYLRSSLKAKRKDIIKLLTALIKRSYTNA
jgi:phage gpG-like protein